MKTGNQSRRFTIFAIPLALMASSACAQVERAASPSIPASVHLTLPSAVAMALAHNRHLLLAHDAVQLSVESKRIGQSHLYPILKNQSAALYITQLQGITVPAGSLAASSPIGPLPQSSLVIAQGADATYTSGTELAEPLTQLYRIHAGVKAAEADLQIADIQESDTTNAIALLVHQLYFGLLIEQTRSDAAQAALDQATVADEETRRGFEQGRLLEDAALASRTDVLDKAQALLVSRLNRNDLALRLDDVLGLPIGTRLELNADAAASAQDLPDRARALTAVLEQNPAVLSARQAVLKARAGVSAAKALYIPDITGIARYSYQSGVPFLRHNFGTFGGVVSYDLFDGGAREAALREARIRLGMAETQLQQSERDVQIELFAAYDKVAQLDQLLAVVQQGVAARGESLRIQSKRAEVGAQLASGVTEARAAFVAAQANELSCRLNLSLAQLAVRKLLGENLR